MFNQILEVFILLMCVVSAIKGISNGQQAGKKILVVRKSVGSSLGFICGLVLLGSAFYDALFFRMRHSTANSNVFDSVLSIVVTAIFSSLIVFMHSSSVRLCENGIYWFETFIRWDDIKSIVWSSRDTNVLLISGDRKSLELTLPEAENRAQILQLIKDKTKRTDDFPIEKVSLDLDTTPKGYRDRQIGLIIVVILGIFFLQRMGYLSSNGGMHSNHLHQADVENNRGVAYEKLGKLDESLKAYQGAVRLSPNNPIFYKNLAGIYEKLGRYPEAIDMDKKAVALKPDFAEAYSDLGADYFRIKRYDDVVIACTKAIKLNPDYFGSYINLGAAYGHLNRYSEAADVFKQAITRNPQNSMAHYNLGFLYTLTGNLEGAQREYETLRTLDQNTADRLEKEIQEMPNSKKEI